MKTQITLLFVLLLNSCATNHKVLGSYYLIDWKGIKADGSVVYPYGEHANGHLSYDASGMMSMQLERANRVKLGTDEYDTVAADEILEAYKGFFSYYGKFSISGETISHQIEGCKNPDWLGRTLRRGFSYSNDTLTIRSDSVIGLNHILRWKRIPVTIN